MKFLFIVGTYELSRNGVSDYVQVLKKHLQVLGHEIYILAINDSVATSSNCDLKAISEKDIVRIPDGFPKKMVLEISEKYISIVKPDIISLQFVPYAFNKKGFPFLLFRFKHLLKKFTVHLMCHELWIDYKKETKLKGKLMGTFQKTLIKKLFKELNPQLITSSIPNYIQRLKPIKAEILPLFGNIEPLEIYPNLTKDKIEFKVVFFGSFSKDIPGFIKQLNFIKTYSNQNKLKTKLLIIGKGGPNKEASLLEVKRILGRHCIEDLGECNASKVSEILFQSDLGLSRSNALYIGKSGASIAMLEHGLPVLIRKESTETENVIYLDKFKNQIFLPTDRPIILSKVEKPIGQQSQIAKQFANMIQEIRNK